MPSAISCYNYITIFYMSTPSVQRWRKRRIKASSVVCQRKWTHMPHKSKSGTVRRWIAVAFRAFFITTTAYSDNCRATFVTNFKTCVLDYAAFKITVLFFCPFFHRSLLSSYSILKSGSHFVAHVGIFIWLK